MSVSQNGYPVLASDETVKWVLPIHGTPKHFILRPGHAGFVLVHYALYHHDEIESLNTQEEWDDWGYANREIRGSSVISNHASGTAIDLNATLHPLSVGGTYSIHKVEQIHHRLGWMDDVIRWGGDYHSRKDEMHFEINRPLATVKELAKRLQDTPRGERIMKANSHYK